MNITDLVTTKRPELRAVGIHYDTRIPVIQTAKRLYLEHGIACNITDTTISIDVPRIAATWWMGALERLTGHPGFNNWDQPHP